MATATRVAGDEKGDQSHRCRRHFAAPAIAIAILPIAFFVTVPIPLATFALALFIAVANRCYCHRSYRCLHCSLCLSPKRSCCPRHRPLPHMLTNAMAMATTWVMALATTLWVAKWAMVRATRAIVINAIGTVAVVLASAVVAAIFIAAATTTISQCRRPQLSHCSGCHHHPPLQHSN
jgi:hypothetical protein